FDEEDIPYRQGTLDQLIVELLFDETGDYARHHVEATREAFLDDLRAQSTQLEARASLLDAARDTLERRIEAIDWTSDGAEQRLTELGHIQAHLTDRIEALKRLTLQVCLACDDLEGPLY